MGSAPEQRSEAVDLAAKLAAFTERWSPRLVAELNGQHVRLAKLEGDFVWHHHAAEDELFLVLAGRLLLDLRDPDERTVELGPGQLFVVPRGTEHRPRAPEETHVLLFEPAATRNTGQLENELTVDPDRLERL
jgi:mannose-6-phosphate isomerase-like protein (cupin superfamily)